MDGYPDMGDFPQAFCVDIGRCQGRFWITLGSNFLGRGPFVVSLGWFWKEFGKVCESFRCDFDSISEELGRCFDKIGPEWRRL